MQNSSGQPLTSMSESTELMIGAAVLVVLIIVIYLIWKWYSAPTTTPAAASMVVRQNVVRGASSTAGSDQVNFGGSRLNAHQDVVANLMFQHEHGVNPPYSGEYMAGATEEENELILAGQLSPDSSVADLDIAPGYQKGHHKNHTNSKHKMELGNLHQQVKKLQAIVKTSATTPAVVNAVESVGMATKSALTSATSM